VKSYIGIALALLAIALLIHIGLGSSENIPPLDTIREIFRGHQNDSPINRIIWSFRLPRGLVCVLAGATLGTCGVIFQSLFRNPLAEPYIIGASSGAAVGGALVRVIGFQSALFGLVEPVAGFLSGMAALLLVMSLARRRGVIETPTMLLAGVVVSTMLSAVLSLVLLKGGKDQGVVLRWLLGYMTETTMRDVVVLSVVFAVTFPLLYLLTRKLNAISLGEMEAQAVGVNPGRVRNQCLVITTAMVATLVGMVGIIGFVGLVAPHISRKVVGVDLRRTLPMTAIVGGLLLLISDTIAQRSGEIPVGIVTAIIGAPSLLVLLRRH
jgi:iron complex transport system permease protein